MHNITPFLWFDGKAEEAAKFYTSIFPKSKVRSITRYGGAGPGPKGSVMTVEFQLDGQKFIALNGGPQFKFNESVSFMVHCKTQAEVDRYWKKLTAGGEEIACGWLRDKYGLCWQIVPTVFFELVSSKDAAKSQRVMQAMMNMVKFDIAKLKQAYSGDTKRGKRK
ncbi:MAG TPA: VOC family protein [Nitrospiraceae bacterium]|nr:VOC family protein [Nitrospiraceae bacterium]